MPRRGLSRRAPAFAAALLTASIARADGRDPAAAEALFRDARAAMERGDYPVACAKLEESQRLDPAPGTLLNLAECEEKRGRLASAWQGYQGALDVLGAGDERTTYAQARATALQPRLPKLVVRLAPNVRPRDVHVRRDDVELGPASLGTEVPVNAGPHEVTVTSPGRRARVYTVVAVEAREVTLVVEVGALEPTSDIGLVGTSAPERSRTLGWIGVSAGAAGIVAGSVFGVLALDRARVSDQHCDAAHTCDPTGLDANRDGKTYSAVSTVCFVAGAALVIGGLAWIFTR